MSSKDFTNEIVKITDLGYSHGFAFGKYTIQNKIDDEIIKLLDNSNILLRAYQESFMKGFEAGIADTHRQE